MASDDESTREIDPAGLRAAPDEARPRARAMPVDDAAMTIARAMPIDDAAMTIARATPIEDLAITDEMPALQTGELPLAPLSTSDIEVLDADDLLEPEAEPEPEPARAPRLEDAEMTDAERALFDGGHHDELVAHYRKRIAAAELTKEKTPLLLRIARVHEQMRGDARAAFDALAEAFELAPDDAEIVAEVDRLGKQTDGLGALADHLRKKVLPRTTDERRGMYLGNIVYWFERVLGRGREVAPLLADLERHDPGHPVLRRRAAQIAATNGDVKGQREQLLRALERTIRREERVTLHLALAEAFAGTSDARTYLERALEEDPSSIVALQAMKRLGREREDHELVRWCLTREIEVAPSDAARVEALLELAVLEEEKFVRRDEAAVLLERVLELQPGHPAALATLERCYHALRDWPRLARVLELRAERSPDRKAKAELLLLAAEVYESKIEDPTGAARAYRGVLVADPKHRRALSDLARIYERLGDWANHAIYKARLAELAPTKRAIAQELVKLGDLLDLPDRDPIAARLQYERAVVIDPSNTAAWEALQRIATEAGDERRVIECLEQRRAHIDVPRQRAAVLVDLGRLRVKRGEQAEARQAFEAAIQADASNEAAATVMLDMYMAEGRWAEAAPLAELLVNAAVRDRDADALFVRRRLATRIAAALGDADRAMLSAVGALDVRPDDPDAQADLVVVASQCRTSAPAAVAKGRAHLARIAEDPGALGGEDLARLAALQRDLGELAAAALLLERARARLPEDAAITRDLAELYLAQGDFPRACKLKLELARNAPSADARFDLLCEAGEIWARRAGELDLAARVLEEARALRPLDPSLLATLRWLYGELGALGPLADVLAELGSAPHLPAGEQARVLAELAELLRDRLDDPERAVEAFEQALDRDPKRLDAFEQIVRLLTAERRWERLAHAYRRMLERAREADARPELEVVLLHQLGLVYRDRLGDAERAYEALDAASQRRPDDAEIHASVVELLIATDNLDAAVARVRADVDRVPLEARLHEELYDLFLRQHAFDKAWCAVDVLGQLRELTAEERQFHEDYAPVELASVPGQLVEKAWTSHLLRRDLEPTLTRLFALITPAALRMRLAELRPEERVGRPFTPKHSRLHDAVRATFANAAEILALPSPDLLLGDPGATTPFAPALAPYGAVLVSGPALDAQAGSLAYLAARCIAEQRPELAARGYFPSAPELTSLLDVAVRVGRGERAKDPAGAALDAAFAAALDEDELHALRAIALGTSVGERTRIDVKAWLRAADLSSARAGLLVAGALGPAIAAIAVEPTEGGAAGEQVLRDRIGELYKFAVSDLYADLRVAIGVVVRGEE